MQWNLDNGDSTIGHCPSPGSLHRGMSWSMVYPFSTTRSLPVAGQPFI
jgi:hypothetical protein